MVTTQLYRRMQYIHTLVTCNTDLISNGGTCCTMKVCPQQFLILNKWNNHYTSFIASTEWHRNIIHSFKLKCSSRQSPGFKLIFINFSACTSHTVLQCMTVFCLSNWSQFPLLHLTQLLLQQKGRNLSPYCWGRNIKKQYFSTWKRVGEI